MWFLRSAPLLLLATLLLSVPIGALGLNLTVDLDYALYRGTTNTTTNIVSWRGIRYAAPPTGKLRWQRPQPPVANRTGVVLADSFGNRCPQAMPSIPGMPFVLGDEDCLFLNVFVPAEGTGTGEDSGDGMPVLVAIHGGGYGTGDAGQDLGGFVDGSGRGVVVVSVQYRLGAFGFLSSPQVKAKGVLNAGLLDQRFALEWVQTHIHKFGGDPDRVTIYGESAGAGSVLLHAIAQNGTLETKLFKNLIAASPWVPTQPYYDSPTVNQHFQDFAALSGCTAGTAAAAAAAFDCLVGKDSLTLQYAANQVSSRAPTPRGNWAFIPVTDFDYVPGPPSVLLQQGRVNGLRLLVGNNANEGALIPPSNIVTESDTVSWIRSYFSNLSAANISDILTTYPVSNTATSSARYETSGTGPVTAMSVSQVATGQQQRVFNMYAEASVICPSYWFGSAFTSQGRVAYHYQYSVPFAVHGSDLTLFYGPPTDNQGPDLIYGNFIRENNPSISNADANGRSSPANPSLANPASSWPPWSLSNPTLINLNQTGGTPYTAVSALGVPVTQFRGPGLRNNFTAADANTWEGGRGARCEFWRRMSPFVPQ
ncbi:alpha/beta-hydrolase [Echria macrotheca]|uniref:Carboxylic ester hydrolase n=1 Tax=Echria macrotheca TaxID=438768 RepID=A0AAJ0BBJ2_9PEZI|nr:alpha/beta-hydrolase [Echria macrotheca]